MTRPALLSLLVLALGCSRAPSVAVAPSPAVAAPPVATVRVVIPAPRAPSPDVPAQGDRATLPGNWHLLDAETDRFAGVSSERALRELLAGRQPRRTVVVAVIDGGIDTAHVDLRANLWTNTRETPGNRRDDDTNAYIDDVRGWKFIGGRDGRNVEHDTFEATRIYAGCRKRAPGGDITRLPAQEAAECTSAAAVHGKDRAEMTSSLPNIQQAEQILTAVEGMLKTALRTDSLTIEQVQKLAPSTPETTRARSTYLALAEQGITKTEIDKARKEITSRLTYGLDLEFNPRPIVGDDTTNVAERGYGNPNVMGPDASHGTHVAGIIGAIRGNGTGIDGVAPAVRIMMIRTIPNGDERDKDVANAIRYAVDNGAQIINMSFGKRFSPRKAAVDAAIKYADAKGVLMIHASGNDSENNDSTASFPTPRYLDGGRPQHWLEVGASSWKGGANLAGEFSNYGRTQVDLFAPGVDILSTIPGGGYERNSGTSMAAPVVSGVAALVMAYYPELSADDVRRVLLASATRHPSQSVTRPGSEQKVPFGSLSVTGGIVNAYYAITMAESMLRTPR